MMRRATKTMWIMLNGGNRITEASMVAFTLHITTESTLNQNLERREMKILLLSRLLRS